MNIHIPAVENGFLHKEYGICAEEKDNIECGIPQKSFEIAWEDIPEETISISLIYMDYDNARDEGVPWIHWLASDIPAKWGHLKEGINRKEEGFVQGHNSWSIPYSPYNEIDEKLTVGFGGPAPSGCHEYELQVFALDSYLELEDGFYLNDLRRAMEGHILDTATVKMKYIGK